MLVSDPATLVQEVVTEELELFTTLVVTDHEPLQKRSEAGDMPGARLVVMSDPAARIAVVDSLTLPAARAGKLIRTWCTATDHGRRIALEVARTLNPAMGGAKVLHVAVPPDQWQPALHPFKDLVETARSTVPTSPSRGTAAAGAEPPPLDTSPAEVARRIILRFGGDLLVVAPPHQSHPSFTPRSPVAYSTGYALDDNGIWRADGDPWARWLIEIADMITQDVPVLGLKGGALSATTASINRIKRPGMVEQVRPDAPRHA